MANRTRREDGRLDRARLRGDGGEPRFDRLLEQRRDFSTRQADGDGQASPRSTPSIEARRLTETLDDVEVLHDLSFAVGEGEILGLAGGSSPRLPGDPESLEDLALDLVSGCIIQRVYEEALAARPVVTGGE